MQVPVFVLPTAVAAIAGSATALIVSSQWIVGPFSDVERVLRESGKTIGGLPILSRSGLWPSREGDSIKEDKLPFPKGVTRSGPTPIGVVSESKKKRDELSRALTSLENTVSRVKRGRIAASRSRALARLVQIRNLSLSERIALEQRRRREG